MAGRRLHKEELQMARYIGKEMSRVDGLAKVTGKAKYAVEFQVPNVAYAFIVQSTIAKGTITTIDTTEAAKQMGVIRIITHQNMQKLAYNDPKDAEAMAPGNAPPFRPLHSDKIVFSGQPIALVVAETFEQARFAARLVKATYAKETSATRVEDLLSKGIYPEPSQFFPVPKPRGNPQQAFQSAPVKIEAQYTIPIEYHNPMEPHGAIAFWQGDKLSIFDKAQWVYNVRNHLASIFGIPPENVQVMSPFVGGAFGSSLRPNYYPTLVALAAREVKRPVKLSYTRRQMFTGLGYRPYTTQKISLGADNKGQLISIIHEVFNNTSTFENYNDNTIPFTRTIYACPNVDTKQKLVKLDLPTPFAMRAPGAVSGMFALESALDELAYKLKMDPLELRLVNYSEKDPDTGKPFSSKALRECYKTAAEKFGWSKRNPEPRSQRDGRWLVGWGMATGSWYSFQMPAGVKLVLKSDGTAHVSSATSDIGPGTYTVITMISFLYDAATTEKVKFELGDSKMPFSPTEGGSWTTASIGSAVYGAAMTIKQKLFEMANREPSSPFRSAKIDDVEMMDGNLRLKTN